LTKEKECFQNLNRESRPVTSGDRQVASEKREDLPQRAMRIHEETSARRPRGVNRSNTSSRLDAPLAHWWTAVDRLAAAPFYLADFA
jgi:hypothetical protein